MGSIPSQVISKTLDMVPIGWVGGLDHKRISGLGTSVVDGSNVEKKLCIVWDVGMTCNYTLILLYISMYV